MKDGRDAMMVAHRSDGSLKPIEETLYRMRLL